MSVFVIVCVIDVILFELWVDGGIECDYVEVGVEVVVVVDLFGVYMFVVDDW